MTGTGKVGRKRKALSGASETAAASTTVMSSSFEGNKKKKAKRERIEEAKLAAKRWAEEEKRKKAARKAAMAMSPAPPSSSQHASSKKTPALKKKSAQPIKKTPSATDATSRRTMASRASKREEDDGVIENADMEDARDVNDSHVVPDETIDSTSAGVKNGGRNGDTRLKKNKKDALREANERARRWAEEQRQIKAGKNTAVADEPPVRVRREKQQTGKKTFVSSSVPVPPAPPAVPPPTSAHPAVVDASTEPLVTYPSVPSTNRVNEQQEGLGNHPLNQGSSPRISPGMACAPLQQQRYELQRPQCELEQEQERQARQLDPPLREQQQPHSLDVPRRQVQQRLPQPAPFPVPAGHKEQQPRCELERQRQAQQLNPPLSERQQPHSLDAPRGEMPHRVPQPAPIPISVRRPVSVVADRNEDVDLDGYSSAIEQEEQESSRLANEISGLLRSSHSEQRQQLQQQVRHRDVVVPRPVAVVEDYAVDSPKSDADGSLKSKKQQERRQEQQDDIVAAYRPLGLSAEAGSGRLSSLRSNVRRALRATLVILKLLFFASVILFMVYTWSVVYQNVLRNKSSYGSMKKGLSKIVGGDSSRVAENYCYMNSPGENDIFDENRTEICRSRHQQLPCPSNGICRGGWWVQCSPSLLFTKDEDSRTCSLTRFAVSILQSSERILSLWTVECLCNPRLAAERKTLVHTDGNGTKTFWFGLDDVSAGMLELKDSAVAVMASKAPSHVTDEHKQALVSHALTTLLIQYNSTKLVVAPTLDAVALTKVGMDGVSLPPSCWARMWAWWMVSCIFAIVYEWIKWLGQTVVANPLQSIGAVVAQYVVYLAYSTRLRRKYIRQTAERAIAAAYEKLVCEATGGRNIYPLFHLREDVAQELFGRSRKEREAFKNQVWPHVILEMKRDARIQRCKQNIGGTPQECWTWLGNHASTSSLTPAKVDEARTGARRK